MKIWENLLVHLFFILFLVATLIHGSINDNERNKFSYKPSYGSYIDELTLNFSLYFDDTKAIHCIYGRPVSLCWNNSRGRTPPPPSFRGNWRGVSVNTFSPKKQMYSLMNGAHAANVTGHGNVSACDLGNSEPEDTAVLFLIPATFIGARDGKKINHYINSTKNAKAVIDRSRAVYMAAPFIASFSARGPQLVTLNILKPHIAAPGLIILAAYSQLKSIIGNPEDNRYAKYNILSGTSMACPDVAAAAAYAAIKSALMTTATPMKIKQMDAELGYGSGQINPTKALNPGLIYDISMSSYIRFLCKEGYNSTAIRLLTGGKKRYNCSSFPPAQGINGLNYPSMHIQLKNRSSNISAVFYRTVTNVGSEKSVYKANVKSPKGLSVTVIPNTLSFDQLGQKISFKVVLNGKFIEDRAWILSASEVWSDAKHTVNSPIVVYTLQIFSLGLFSF